jgi:hypothetical protein
MLISQSQFNITLEKELEHTTNTYINSANQAVARFDGRLQSWLTKKGREAHLVDVLVQLGV